MSWGLWVYGHLEIICSDQTEEGCSLKPAVWLLEYRKKVIFSVSFGTRHHDSMFCFELQGSFLPADAHVADTDEWRSRGFPNSNLCFCSVWWQQGLPVVPQHLLKMRLLQLWFGQQVHHFWYLVGFGMRKALTDADVLVEPPQPLGRH